MEITAIDHIVLVVADVERTCRFYEMALGMHAVEHRPGQWALQMGRNKINLRAADTVPLIAQRTTPGTGNFCLLTSSPMNQVIEPLRKSGVTLIEGPAWRVGAAGMLVSVYFYDPDGNLVEVSNVVKDPPTPAWR